MAALRSLVVVFTLVLSDGMIQWLDGGGVQFGEFVDAGAKFLLDVTDAVILLEWVWCSWPRGRTTGPGYLDHSLVSLVV